MTLTAMLLAAGKGTRMKSERAKVLAEAAGSPLVLWMYEAAVRAGAESIVAVVGYQADEVAAVLPGDVITVEQTELLGTGHAAAVGLKAIDTRPGDTLLVLPGDMPLIRGETLRRLVDHHEATSAAATVLSVEVDDPTGYGRIVRSNGSVAAIVEHRDASRAELEITEINTSVYAFAATELGSALDGLGNHNDQGEFYLTDVVGQFAAGGNRVEAVLADAEEGAGVNSHAQLAGVAAQLRARINQFWMDQGVWLEDPATTYIDAGVTLEADAMVYAGTHLRGATHVAAGAQVGPEVHATDTTIGPGARVWYSVVRGAEIGAAAEVGPYVSLRPGTTLEEGSKAGTFVEIKNSVVGPGSKVPHLAYVGDTEIGVGANVGAGTIVANYDGYEKHRTKIGDGVKIGSNNVLVAPVALGDEAWTGAGSIITRDVAPGALAVSRSAQSEIPGYAARRRARAERESR